MESNNKICSLSISYKIIGDGLLGGKYEYDLYTESHTSFGDYRLKKEDKLIRLPDIITPAESSDPDADTITMSEKIAVYSSSEPIELTLNDYDRMKGDDTLHIKLFSHTRYSGVDSIDKSEGKYVERQIADGIVEISLHNLFNFYKRYCEAKKLGSLSQKSATFIINDFFTDQKVIDEKSRDLLHQGGDPTDEMISAVIDTAKPLCNKACIALEITIRDFDESLYRKSIFNTEDLTVNHINAMLPLNQQRNQGQKLLSVNSGVPSHTQSRPSCPNLLYNSEKSWSMWVHTMGGCLELYMNHFMGNDQTARDPLYKPAEPVVSNLQLPQYISDFGKLPPYAYWANSDPFYREYATEEERAEDFRRYGFKSTTEPLLLMMLRSSLRRFGLSEATYMKEIAHHFSPQNMSTLPTPNFLRAEQVLAHVGSFAANTANYTADYRFMAETEGQHGHASKHKTGGIGELRMCPTCGKEKLRVKVLQLDSWDDNILNNTSNCDDCEGQDKTATAILRTYGIGRPELGFNWESPLLQASNKLLDHSVIYDTGSLVTSAFMDTNNKKIESKQDEMPLIGSELDKNAQNDGHCFPLLHSLSSAIDMVDAGNTRKEVVAKMREANSISQGNEAQQKAFLQRDKKRGMLVLEPTGSIEARLLPLEESYGSEACDDATNRLFMKEKAMFFCMKEMRVVLKEFEKDIDEEDENGVSIVDMFVGEGLPHYVSKQDRQRRVSSFYNSVVHGTSVDLMRFDPTLAQFAFCKNDRYGVRIGGLIRGDDDESRLSLICPYADYKEKWMTEVVPMVASIHNQMPIMKFGRYSDQEYAEKLYSRYVSPKEMTASLNLDLPLPPSKERAESQRQFEAHVAEVDDLASNKTMVRFYSRTWKLNQSKEKTERLMQFINMVPGLITFGIYVERHIPVCDPIVEILCVVNVEQCLALPVIAK